MSRETFERPPFARIVREPACWVLAGFVVLFFARPLFFGETFFFRDLSLLALPQRMRLVELIRASGFPLWDPYLQGGQPFLGNPSNLALYPTAALYFVLSPLTAFNLEIVLHFALCAFAAYWLARTLGIGPAGSLVAGAAFALCGFTLSCANLLNRLLAMPNTAFLILFWHLFLLERKRRWFVLAAASGTLVVLAGSVEFLLLAALVALGWAWAYPYSQASPAPKARILAWGAMLLVIVGTAAVQILPGLEVIGQSVRGSGLDFRQAMSWSLHPLRLPELLLPGYLGPTDTLEENDYWGHRLEEGFPLILSVTFGLPVLAFAAVGALAADERGLPRRFRRFLAGCALAAIVLALGRFALLTPAVYRAARLVQIFRYPIKALFAAVLPVALLAGAGAARIARLENAEPGGKGLVRWLWAASALFGLLGAIAASGGSAATLLERALFLADPGEPARPQAALPFLHGAAAAAILAAILQAQRRRRRTWLPVALAGLALADLAVSGRSVNSFAPRALLEREPASASAVRSHLAGGRLFREPTPDTQAVVAPSNRIFWRFLLRRETLDYYTGSAFGIPVVFHTDFDGLAQQRMVDLTSVLAKLPWERRLPLLSAANATVLVAAERPPAADLEPVAEFRGHGKLTFRAYRNPAAAPRVGFVTTSAVVQSADDALRAVLSRGFDPRRHVVLEGHPEPVRSSACADARIAELERTPISWTGRVTAGCAGHLVFAEPDYPGWRAEVDGKPEPILRANVAFSALALPAGAHTVSRNYRPKSVALGVALSAATTAVTAGVVLFGFRRRRPESLPR